MKLWIDAQLSPAIADWIKRQYGWEAIAVRDLGFRSQQKLVDRSLCPPYAFC
ncbi:MAG: DUF5615 family PIN-like protein [Gammaproteobacteria bacterium]|nr:DUF5615 family PIN-like protein [Gammaproteobacteria bacterium]